MEYQAADTVALTKSIADWLLQAGVSDAKRRADISVDLADLMAAASRVEANVQRLLRERPDTTAGAEAALTLAADIEVQLFTELASHLTSLRRAWPGLLERLDALSTG